MSKKNGVIFDLGESQGDWFDFFESTIDLTTGDIVYSDPKPGTGRACFRPSGPFLKKQLAQKKKKSEFVLNPKNRRMERIEYLETFSIEEEQKAQDDLTDYMITGLIDFFDMEGNPIECTRENKIKLAMAPVFDRFMARCMELQLNASAEQKEKSRKNSGKP